LNQEHTVWRLDFLTTTLSGMRRSKVVTLQ